MWSTLALTSSAAIGEAENAEQSGDAMPDFVLDLEHRGHRLAEPGHEQQPPADLARLRLPPGERITQAKQGPGAYFHKRERRISDKTQP